MEHEFYDFPYIGNVIIPTDELIFLRGRYTTSHQPVFFLGGVLYSCGKFQDRPYHDHTHFILQALKHWLFFSHSGGFSPNTSTRTNRQNRAEIWRYVVVGSAIAT